MASRVRCLGDNRLNEQPALIALQTIFGRLHNQFEAEVYRMNPSWPGERLYQETRRLITAVYQSIIYNEYLPVVLGRTHYNRFIRSDDDEGKICDVM